MKYTRYVAISLIILTWHTVSFARISSANSVSATSSTTSRGPFSLHIGYGYDEIQLLNSSGTDSTFRGSGSIFNMDLRLGQPGPGEFRLFGMAKMMKLKAQLNGVDTIVSNEFAGGLKVFTLNWLYFGGGMGVTQQSISVDSATTNATNPYYFAQMGLEIPISNIFYLHLSGIAHVNGIKRTQQMTSHSLTHGFGAAIFLTFSPADTFVTNMWK